MSTHKHIDRICAVVIVLTLLLTVLFMNGASLGLQAIVDEDAEQNSDSVYFTAKDQVGDWDSADATVITLNGESGTISGNGAYFYDGNVYITGGGYYVVSGTLADGSVIVDAYDSSKVWILLNGVDITCSDDACIRIDEADKVFLTLAEGTENTLQSGTEYSETALADGTDGVIFAHEDLTINGSGSLTVTGGWKHGIAANDDLVITGGTITVDTVKDGIRANDSLRIKNADITVTAGDDGIVVAKEDGYLYIESGTIHITSAEDGIHTAGDITIAGGSFTIDAGDDGIHSDTAIAIADGTILITECYEGIEANTIDITGGDITVYPSDDGLNANGGSGDQFGFGGMGGPGQMAQSGSSEEENSSDSEDAETYIRISGGTLTIINENGRDADGLDSNGSIYITGGTIWVSLLGDGSNSALDYGSENGGVCEISGGTIIACGGSSMAEGFDSGSSQCSILYNLTDSCDAGTAVSLTDADGTVLLTWDVPCSLSSLVISCPEMELGETYQLLTGNSAETVTLEEVATSLGSVQAGMFGGGMNMGGGMSSRSDGERPDMGQMPQTEDGEQPDMSQMPQREDGEMPDMSQMPQREDGEMPDMGQMPQREDGEMPGMSEMGTLPVMDSSSGRGPGGHGFGGTSDGERSQRGDGDFQQQNLAERSEVQAEEETAASAADWTDVSVWIIVSASALVLLAGLAIGLFIKH
ncbi:MAG: carbohydrate-binding domain-containing protein [Oscillospiraceae bacterium]|nr:carbohydrate-binding domain-containing protein [Oscillospiraceae bacterium]